MQIILKNRSLDYIYITINYETSWNFPVKVYINEIMISQLQDKKPLNKNE
jgi:hypothetical protein